MKTSLAKHQKESHESFLEQKQRNVIGENHKYARLPWRVIQADNGCWQVWTRQDDTPGSLNNYVVADGIQDEREACLLAAAPAMFEALRDLLSALGQFGAEGQPIDIARNKARAALKLAGGGE